VELAIGKLICGCLAGAGVQEKVAAGVQQSCLSAPAGQGDVQPLYMFNHRDQQVLAQALQDLYSARATLLAAQPPPQPQQVLHCPRMTAFVRYCQEQQRRREAGVREMVDWY
jgi:hypothetical protein